MKSVEKIPATMDKLAVPVGSVRPVLGNPRRGNVEVIAESLERNGQYRPIVVNKRSGEILAGNHTYAAARHLGWERIAVTFVDVDEDQAARIILADNRTADVGTYHDDLLLAMLRGLDGDLEGTGYHDDDLEALEALAGDVKDLDQLADEVGDLDDADTWPVLSFAVPPHVNEAWTEHLKGHGTEADALAALLGVTGT